VSRCDAVVSRCDTGVSHCDKGVSHCDAVGLAREVLVMLRAGEAAYRESKIAPV
jgi:hypothetical protein